ncbi:MAG: DUF1611 domain-containing protein [Saprospiraceae bacterium]
MNPLTPVVLKLSAGRPNIVVMQHAPARKEYDGPLVCYAPVARPDQSGGIPRKTCQAITVNHEDIPTGKVKAACDAITEEVGLPA